MSLVEMIQASFGERIASKAQELVDQGMGQRLSLLQLVHEAERRVWESQYGPFHEFEMLRTNSHLIEDVEHDEET